MENEASTRTAPLDVVIGLGANVGDTALTLRRALAELAALGEVIAVSALYRSTPVGGPPQPDFLNAAARLKFSGTPDSLLAEALRIERLAGRVRRERWGPRSLDLDILWIAGLRVAHAGLHIPHARLRERAFALQPLLDVAPEARDPADGEAYRAVLDRLGTAGVERLGTDLAGAVAGHSTRGMDRPRS
ncbi:MAG TPA: 2-amino-4-hydroxy-6-hydroxymethyldihydropteridine diphosphokinase [Polyangiaceae bacterium]|nr:2-amino-4-hydroxy-6-hydroxymethyldihydropteridine diphosphokinase [Polyangiaceae bacterium]